MTIKTLHITSFGGLNDCTIELSDGVNIIGGENESGKTSAAMFIKFIFYGLSSKTLKADGASERTRFVNRDTMTASGYIEATSDDGGEYRIERSLVLGSGSPREKIRIINENTGDIVTGEEPGEYFFGVPEAVFVGTAFVGQNKSVKPDISGEGASKGSVENLLTSADENVDIKRAVKRLDEVRRELAHKNGSGGEISNLKDRCAALKKERDDTAARAADILSATASVNDIKQKIDEYSRTEEKQKKIFSSLRKINLKNKFDEYDKTVNAITDLTESVKMIDSSPFGGDFGDSLASAGTALCEYDEKKREYDEKMPTFPESDDVPDEPDVDEVTKEAERLDKKARALFVLGIVSLVLGIAALGTAVGMYMLTVGNYLIPFAVAVVLAPIGIMFLVLRSSAAKKLVGFLDGWRADSLEDLPNAVDAKIAAIRVLRDRVDEKLKLEDDLGEAENRKNAAVAVIGRLALSVGMQMNGDADVTKTFAALGEMLAEAKKERAELLRKADKNRGRLEVLAEQLDGTDRTEAMNAALAVLETDEGKIAVKMTADDIKELEKQRDFTHNALQSAEKRKESLDERLSELGKLSRSPDELSTSISALEEKITELSLRRDAVETAQNALERAGEAMRADVIPKLGRKASEYVKSATGRYSKMTVDGSFACALGNEDEYKTAELFSRGTADLVYIALRVALADEVFHADRPTVVFDESFAHVDSERLENTLKMLADGDGQYIIFTCRTEEADAAQKLGGNVTKLFAK